MEVPQFYNSLSKQVEPLNPKEPGKVRIYNCGPTVYKRQHIGNMRRYLFADFLRRSLEFLGYEVREIMNITDVGHLTQDDIDAGEDKLEKQAKAEQKTPQFIANEQIALFQQDLQALNIQPAHKYPRASEHIQGMQGVIGKLIENGHAYQTESGVYFDVTTFPEYGKLSGNTLENISAGARVEIRGDKKHPADFALWKTDDPEHLQRWDSPWGKGYPGWHIECSAMALEYLGSDIDIHTGGEDNRFPHHENEIAQSEAATGEQFARLWMHNRHLLSEGKKLAKREGQQITLDTLTEEGYSPLAFRLLIFASHYRTPVDFSWDAMHQAAQNIDTIRHMLQRIKNVKPTEPNKDAIEKFGNSLAEDLNTPAALAAVLEYIRSANSSLDTNNDEAIQGEILATLLAVDSVLGVVKPLLSEKVDIPAEIKRLAAQREEARKNKDFAAADDLRNQIEAAGYSLEDTPNGFQIRKR